MRYIIEHTVPGRLIGDLETRVIKLKVLDLPDDTAALSRASRYPDGKAYRLIEVKSEESK